MNYVIAVSGGVDSVVLLDMVVRDQLLDYDQLIVAHFDHGIRSDSADDAEFVRQLAVLYGLPFETFREELGVDASEETARDRRYAFLRSVAKKYNAVIVTAHHADDVVESVVINIQRGTGWRGLAVMDSPGVTRPLVSMRKAALIEYAIEHRLEWREDSTNSETKYLRNRLRAKTRRLDDTIVDTVRSYREHQIILKNKINTEIEQLLGTGSLGRYLFISVSPQVGRELLRHALIAKTGSGATRPQLDRVLLAIKTLQAGKRYEVNNEATLRFTKTNFVIE